MAALLLVLYQTGATLLCLLASPYLGWRLLRHPSEMRERFGSDAAPAPRGRIWIHAASLGEVEAVATLLRARPSLAGEAVLTVTSVSARRLASARLGSIPVRFAPLDLWFVVPRVVARLEPRALILIETELWPLLLQLATRRRIPMALLSGRISRKHRSRLRLHGSMLRRLLPRTLAVGAQTEDDASAFRGLGLVDVTVTGNLKHRLPEGAHVEPRPFADGGFLWVAGSLRRGEEFVLDAVSPRARLVLVPRHLREIARFEEALRVRRLRYRLRSDESLRELALPATGGRAGLETARAQLFTRLAEEEVLLVDRQGELNAWYAMADAAYLGGTGVPIGGHNLFEPLAQSVPTAFGPHRANIEALADLALAQDAARETPDAPALSRWLAELSEDSSRRKARAEAAFGVAQLASGSVDASIHLLERHAIGVAASGRQGAARP